MATRAAKAPKPVKTTEEVKPPKTPRVRKPKEVKVEAPVFQRTAITNKDPMTFVSFEAVVEEIKQCLAKLKILALKTDFSVPEQRQNYFDNVAFLKRFYERAERLVTR